MMSNMGKELLQIMGKSLPLKPLLSREMRPQESALTWMYPLLAEAPSTDSALEIKALLISKANLINAG